MFLPDESNPAMSPVQPKTLICTLMFGDNSQRRMYGVVLLKGLEGRGSKI